MDPFEESRRLTGCNACFAEPGVALETARGLAFDDAALERWRLQVSAMRGALGWAQGAIHVRRHASGATLAFAAPLDRLYAATEANEWAWRAALHGGAHGATASPPNGIAHAPGHASWWDAATAMQTLRALAAAEANPALLSLRDAAARHGVPFLVDDDLLSIGAGDGSRTWAVQSLPAAGDVDWASLHDIPTALVTGSNGKTTTVRLLAAMARAQGWHAAHSCTDGVFFDGEALESGDFSGPMGARTVLRHRQVQAAILETARGGLLRRGMATCRADAAVVTNISEDHFGEYGVHDLDDLARVKLTVARAIGADGLLVLNADDPVLTGLAPSLACPLGWFSLDDASPLLVAHRDGGGATCAVADGRMRLHWRGGQHDLGAVADMPLTLGGQAAYNVANAAAAALAACALGISVEAVVATLRRFGAAGNDNPGRLQHWTFGGVQVFVDYAHNPDGLRGFLQAVGADRRTGRLAILLGHAGNREDADLRAVARTAAAFDPDLVVLKDIGGYERGRGVGEVAAIMRDVLAAAGLAGDRVETCLDEVEAARRPLQWARDGDLLVLPVHELDARIAVVALLDALQAGGWRAGDALPPRGPTQ
ncbi:MAG TPA: Mur ligase family protein [Luteimonas sp.]|nr:Mur ligase family protein [Luteimonas sp.]